MPRLAMPRLCKAELILAIPCLCHTIPIATDLCCSFAMPFSSMPSLCPSRQFLAMPLPLIPPQIVTSPFHCLSVLSSSFAHRCISFHAIPSPVISEQLFATPLLFISPLGYSFARRVDAFQRHAFPSPAESCPLFPLRCRCSALRIPSMPNPRVSDRHLSLPCVALAVYFQSPRFGALPSRLVSRLIFAFP